MKTFNDHFEACEFSRKNPNTLVKCVRNCSDGSIVKCYYFNLKLHGVYIMYNNDSSIEYRDFNIQGSWIDDSSLSEIQLQSIFGECYGNL